jgi:hypothetical protein
MQAEHTIDHIQRALFAGEHPIASVLVDVSLLRCGSSLLLGGMAHAKEEFAEFTCGREQLSSDYTLEHTGRPSTLRGTHALLRQTGRARDALCVGKCVYIRVCM